MITAFLRTILIFGKTFYYLLRSYRKETDIVRLKQQWAISFLKTFNIDLRVKNSFSEERNLIFVGNHIGFLDIIVLFAVEPRLVFLAKAELAAWPIIGPAARRIETLFVKRDSAASRSESKKAIHQRICDPEKSTLIAGFPSGTTCLDENVPWRKGLFEIAMATETPVQAFRFRYSPLRACAYIENDNLFTSLMKLFSTRNITATLEWGPCYRMTDLPRQMAEMQAWTQSQQKTHEEKSFSRPAYSLELQRR